MEWKCVTTTQYVGDHEEDARLRPKSKLSEVEIVRSRNWPKSKVFAMFLLFLLFLVFFSFFSLSFFSRSFSFSSSSSFSVCPVSVFVPRNICPKPFFSEKRMSVTQNSSQKHYACLASPSTSCTEGTRPPAPGSSHLDVPATKLRTLSLRNKTTVFFFLRRPDVLPTQIWRPSPPHALKGYRPPTETLPTTWPSNMPTRHSTV